MVGEKFWTHTLFRNKGHVKLSYEEIAKLCNVSLRSAKSYIKRDVAKGLIERWNSYYGHPVSNRICTGKNVYYLTPKGKKLLRREGLC